MSKVTQSVRIRTRPGQAKKFIELYGPMMEIASKEPGTILYVINRSASDPDLFFSFEVFDSESDRQAHETNPETGKYFQESGMAELFDVIDGTQSSAVHANGLSR